MWSRHLVALSLYSHCLEYWEGLPLFGILFWPYQDRGYATDGLFSLAAGLHASNRIGMWGGGGIVQERRKSLENWLVLNFEQLFFTSQIGLKMVENTPAARMCSHLTAEPQTSVQANSLGFILLCACVIWILNNPPPPQPQWRISLQVW